MRNALSYLTAGKEPAWTRWLLLAVAVPVTWLFVIGVRGNSETFNTSREASLKNDQKVYIGLAQSIKRAALRGDKKFTPRQRTPGLPYILSVFWSPEYGPDPVVDEGYSYSLRWFERCKTICTWIAGICLLGLFAFFCWRFTRTEAALLTAALTCLLYVFRAGYTQPEVLYWSLNLVLFYLLWQMLVAPNWKLAIAAGLLSGPAFMIKAGTQPLLLLFVVSFGLKLLWDRFNEGTPRRIMLVRLAQAAFVPVMFLLSIAPYTIGSYKIFGSPFYSVYQDYLMWTLPEVQHKDKLYVDRDKTHALEATRAAYQPVTVDDYRRELKKIKDKRVAQGQHESDPTFVPYTEPAELPSMARYLREQSAGQILARGLQGIRVTKKRMEKYYPSAWSFLRLALFAALAVGIYRWRWVWQQCRRRGYLPFYFVGFFSGYLFLYGWYDALRIGPRLMLGLYPTALFCAFAAIFGGTRNLAIPFRGQQLRVSRILVLVFAGLLIYHASKVFTGELYAYFSGT